MRLLFNASEMVAAWVRQRVKHVPSGGFGPCTAIGVTDDEGRLVAGVVYFSYDGGTLTMAVAADDKRWATRFVLRALFAYPFNQAKCRRVTAVTPKRAKSTRAFLLRLGFTLEGHLRQQFADDDAMIYGMLRRDWEAAGGDVLRIGKNVPRGTIAERAA